MNKKKLFCSNCHKETWHEFLFEKNYKDDSPSAYDYCSKSLVTECCGCEQPHYFWNTWIENEDGSIESSDEWVFPPKSIHQPPSWYINFSFSTVFDETEDKKQVSNLLREVHSALEKNSPRLGIMGIRAIFEHIMISKVGDSGTFKKNLQELQSEGYISKMQHDSMSHILEAGHAAIHRSHEPDLGELIAALEITEGLIETIYINPEKSKWVSKNVKPR
ncbi:MAG: DUF4145 domain-containing protein [Pseudomonadota bacterium]